MQIVIFQEDEPTHCDRIDTAEVLGRFCLFEKSDGKMLACLFSRRRDDVDTVKEMLKRLELDASAFMGAGSTPYNGELVGFSSPHCIAHFGRDRPRRSRSIAQLIAKTLREQGYMGD